jgi:hypothetical protein
MKAQIKELNKRNGDEVDAVNLVFYDDAGQVSNVFSCHDYSSAIEIKAALDAGTYNEIKWL